VQEGEALLVGHLGWAYHAFGRAVLALGRRDVAKCVAEPAHLRDAGNQ